MWIPCVSLCLESAACEVIIHTKQPFQIWSERQSCLVCHLVCFASKQTHSDLSCCHFTTAAALIGAAKFPSDTSLESCGTFLSAVWLHADVGKGSGEGAEPLSAAAHASGCCPPVTGLWKRAFKVWKVRWWWAAVVDPHCKKWPPFLSCTSLNLILITDKAGEMHYQRLLILFVFNALISAIFSNHLSLKQSMMNVDPALVSGK